MCLKPPGVWRQYVCLINVKSLTCHQKTLILNRQDRMGHKEVNPKDEESVSENQRDGNIKARLKNREDKIRKEEATVFKLSVPKGQVGGRGTSGCGIWIDREWLRFFEPLETNNNKVVQTRNTSLHIEKLQVFIKISGNKRKWKTEE